MSLDRSNEELLLNLQYMIFSMAFGTVVNVLLLDESLQSTS